MDGHYFAKIDELIIGSEENKEQILDHPLQYMIWLKFDQCLGRRRFLRSFLTFHSIVLFSL